MQPTSTMRQLRLLIILLAVRRHASAVPLVRTSSFARQQAPVAIQEARRPARRANAIILEKEKSAQLLPVTQDTTSTSLEARLQPPTEAQHAAVVHPLETTDKSAPRRKVSRKILFVSYLSFMTGFVDVLCYHRYNCYVNMMTGNSIRLMTALAESQWTSALFSISLLTTYSVGIMLFRVTDLKCRRHREQQPLHSTNELRTCAVAAPLMLLLFVLADVVSYYCADYRIHAPLLSMAFGLLNAASADATGGTILYAMTGNITKIAKAIADFVLDSKRHKAPKSSLAVLGSFLGGIFLSVKAKHYTLPLIEQAGVPFCSIVGLVYSSLLLWYGRVSFFSPIQS